MHYARVVEVATALVTLLKNVRTDPARPLDLVQMDSESAVSVSLLAPKNFKNNKSNNNSNIFFP